jgi:hypothetical protein
LSVSIDFPIRKDTCHEFLTEAMDLPGSASGIGQSIYTGSEKFIPETIRGVVVYPQTAESPASGRRKNSFLN